MKRPLVAVVAALVSALVPAPAVAATSARSKAEIVCFKKTVTTKSGRKVRRKVCRPRRKAKAVKHAPAATTPPRTTPDSAQGPGPSPNFVEGPGPFPHATTGPAVAAPVCVPEDSDWLTVTALDLDARFVLRLSRTCLRAGRTVVQLRNQDAQEHDLWVEGTAPLIAKREVVASAAPESLEQSEMHLSAGEWRLFCSIPGHGTMSRTVSVAG